MIKTDQFAAVNEAAIDQFSYFAKLSLSNLEKFTELGLGAAREGLTQATRHAQSLAGARDVHEVIALSSAAVEPALKRAYTYSRTAYETAVSTNDEIKRAFEQNTAELNKAAVAAFEEAFKYAPAGGESIVGNLKTAFATAQSAYDNFTAINKQIATTVERNVASAQAVATGAAKSTKGKRAKRSK